MQIKILLLIFSLLLNILACKPVKAVSVKLTIPEEINSIMKELRCTELKEFYNVPGFLEPPYIYGYRGSHKEETVTFWCKDNLKYGNKLIHYNRITKSINSMQWENPAGGLSIYSIDNTDQDIELLNVLNHKKIKIIKKGSQISFIKSYYDGAGAYFYFDNKEWWFFQFH